MSAISRIYQFAIAIKGGDKHTTVAGRHHNHPSKKLPDEAVLELRREWGGAKNYGEKSAIVRKYTEKYSCTKWSVWSIANYQSRSSRDRPLDPSLVDKA